ncbi:MAG: tetratricopeptide repeat-containing sensor histidine kinase [Bacteroidia bacterium]
MREKFVFCLFLLTAVITHSCLAATEDSELSQLIDSLRKRSEMNLHDTEKMKVYYDLGDYLVKAEPEAAKKYLDLSLALSEKYNNLKLKKRNLERIGVYFKDKGKYGIALSYQINALRIAEKQQDTFGIAVCCNNIGVIYKSLHKYDKALEYYLRSNKLCELANKTQGYIMTLNNIGTTYNDQGDYKKAKPYYEKALEKARETDDNSAISVALNNLGEVYAMEEKHDKALLCFKQCLEIDRKVGDQFGELLSIINIAGSYVNLQQYKQAESEYYLAFELAHKLNGNYYLSDIHKNLSELFTKMANHKKAFEHFKLHVSYKDSIFNEENNKNLSDLQLQYETEKKEQAIVSLNNEKEYKNAKIKMQKSVQVVSISIGLLLLLSLLSLYNLYRLKARTNEQLILLNKEKNEFLSIAAHDLKNPLQTIKGYCRMQKDYFDKLSKEKMLHYTHNIEIAARNMVELISNLLDINAIESGHIKNQTEDINLNEFMEKVVENFRLAANQKNIWLLFVPHKEISIMAADASWLKQIADNLMSNAIKYSPINSEVTLAIINDGKTCGFYVQDHGEGISKTDQKQLFNKFTRLSSKPTAGESSNGLGLSIVKKLADIIGADILCDSDTGKGCRFTVVMQNEK